MANGYLSNAFADIILAATLTRDVADLPLSYWVGLTLALPIDGDGTGIEVPDAAEYARVEVVGEVASWLSMGVGSRAMETAVDVVFATSITDWGQILGYTLHDAAVDGVYLGFGITNPYLLTAGMTARLPAGTIVISMPITG
jgi:hypothetical protein